MGKHFSRTRQSEKTSRKKIQKSVNLFQGNTKERGADLADFFLEELLLKH